MNSLIILATRLWIGCSGKLDTWLANETCSSFIGVLVYSGVPWTWLKLHPRMTTVECHVTGELSLMRIFQHIRKATQEFCAAKSVSYFLTACPHCRRKVRLSHKSETVSLLWDSLTFLRQCRQGFTQPQTPLRAASRGAPQANRNDFYFCPQRRINQSCDYVQPMAAALRNVAV